MKEETYLEFLDGDMTGYVFNCPFQLPMARTYQCMLMVALTYKCAIELQEVLELAGHKMNDHAILAFRREIGQYYHEIVNWKAGVEN